MKLYQLNIDGVPERAICEGDEVVTRDGKTYIVAQGIGSRPHKPSSTGRIWVVTLDGDSRQFFPGVFNCKWLRREK